MRILLHGATNYSNFGDYLFAELFYTYLKEKGHQVEFYNHPKYGVSWFFKKYLNYDPGNRSYRKMMKQSEALVFFSGGYFVEPLKKGIIREYQRINRYFTPAFYFMKHKRPIYIMGVGAGPFTGAPFSRIAKKVLNYASVVTVRNDESKDFCVQYGVTRQITVTADTALVINRYMQTHDRERTLPFDKKGKKLCLLHIDVQTKVKEIIRSEIAPALLDFLSEHPEYKPVLVSDGVMNENVYSEYREMLAGADPEILRYDDPWTLCSCIRQSDLILTTKLHVGIIGCAMGASVLSFPFVPNKTKRFYKQIGEPDRCVALSETDRQKVREMLIRFHDSKIAVPETLVDKAEENLRLLPGSDQVGGEK